MSELLFQQRGPICQGDPGQIDQLNAQLDKLTEGGDLTLVSWEKPSIAYADILVRGIYSARKERVEANTPHFLPPLPAGDAAQSAGAGEVDGESGESADGASHRESHVERTLWDRAGGDDGRLRHHGRASFPSRTAGLAGGGIPGERLEREAHVQADGDVRGLSPEREVDPGAACEGPEESAAGARAALPHGCRDAAGYCAPVERVAGEQNWRPQREAVPAGQCVGAGEYPASDTLNYMQEHGDALYRRSLYTFWKRMATMPDMDVFDAPMRDVACTRRQRTDTPLQALVTMNDAQWVEAARALAERVIEEGGQQPAQRIKYLSDILLSHDPPPQMEAVLQKSFDADGTSTTQPIRRQPAI